MADTEYHFTNADGTHISTRDPAAANHMRYDLGFTEAKPTKERAAAPVAATADDEPAPQPKK